MTTFVLFLSFFVCRQYPNGAAFENRFDLSTYNDEHLVRLTIYQSRHPRLIKSSRNSNKKRHLR